LLKIAWAWLAIRKLCAINAENLDGALVNWSSLCVSPSGEALAPSGGTFAFWPFGVKSVFSAKARESQRLLSREGTRATV
jgi:hypothetical protein